MKITTIYFPDESKYEEIHELAYQQRTTVSAIARETLDDYCKSHGTENKSMDIGKYLENPESLSTPNYYAEIKTWKSYLTKCSDVEFKKWAGHLNDLLKLENKIVGTR